MKKPLEWGLLEDNTDCQNLYPASAQLEPPQHLPHPMKGAFGRD